MVRVLAITGLLASLAALPGPSPEELERNRLRLNDLSAPQLARLRRDAEAFLALSPEQQKRLVKLDHDLHQQLPAEQGRLKAVLERYSDWLQGLPEADRKLVRNAGKDRLRIVAELRERDWLAQQPKAVRQRVERLEGEERARLVRQLRQEDRQRRLDWLIAGRFWDELTGKKSVPLPSRLGDFHAEVQNYVHDFLLPILSKEEKERLEGAEGKWPQYPMALVEIADKHPPALPGPTGPKSFDELPKEIQKRLKIKAGLSPKMVKAAEGKWPDYAVAVAELVAKRGTLPLPHEYWASGFKSLTPPVQDFVKSRLQPVLISDDKLRLLQTEGKWPEYPLTVQELARKHGLEVPWFTLPPRDKWENYRLRPTSSDRGS